LLFEKSLNLFLENFGKKDEEEIKNFQILVFILSVGRLLTEFLNFFVIRSLKKKLN